MGMDAPLPPRSEASRQDNMRAIWEQAGLASVETRVIRIRVSFADFDDFWDSMSSAVGPAGQAISKLSPDGEGKAQDAARDSLPSGPIAYEALPTRPRGGCRPDAHFAGTTLRIRPAELSVTR